MPPPGDQRAGDQRTGDQRTGDQRTGDQRVGVIGAGPCGLTALKNLLQAGLHNLVGYDEHHSIGGNWAFTNDPQRPSVHANTHSLSSRRLAAFHDFPMPDHYPDFPTHRQLLAYFTTYASAFGLGPHLRLGTHVERCTLDDDGRWTVHVTTNGQARAERFDSLLVCTGHHRRPYLPTIPGRFTGQLLHSAAYKRPDPFRGQRVLVVGAGNSAADIAVEVAPLAAHTALSLHQGTYFLPHRLLGRPIDVVDAFWRGKLPRPLLQSALQLWLRLTTGRWEAYGLPAPTHAPLDRPPTVNSSILPALRGGRLVARPGIARYAGPAVQFTDGTREAFDAIILATGFRPSFPFLSEEVAGWDLTTRPPLYLRMMHPTIPSLFFVGLFQPVGCIWRLADYQARIAALQLSGRLQRPSDIAARIRHEVAHPQHRFHPSPRHAIEVDYHTFQRQLLRELATAKA